MNNNNNQYYYNSQLGTTRMNANPINYQPRPQINTSNFTQNNTNTGGALCFVNGNMCSYNTWKQAGNNNSTNRK